jgi:hypothetical protein
LWTYVVTAKGELRKEYRHYSSFGALREDVSVMIW